MKKLLTLFCVLLLSLAVACESEEAAEAEPADEATTEEAAEDEEPAAEEELAMVEVADDGTVFDPPVQPEQIPDGVYYCDMGTVHYARGEEGDGRCTECNMMLTHKGGAAPAHDHDHDHDDHDHAH